MPRRPGRPTAPDDFARRLLDWQREHGRRDLPWQGTRDPYRVWLSEIMLQQTQVATATPYYLRFLERYADVQALAAAPLEAVMALWAGLGYYSRARNLHACAQAVVRDHGGAFPRSATALAQLPGIGRSTAAAIAAFCFDERAAILDGNVKRVLARRFGIDGPVDDAAGTRRLWALAESLLPPAAEMPRYTQAIMDLGATVCVRTRPRCSACPLADACAAHATGRTAQLPAPRARAAPRVRAAAMLVVLADKQVLLERRPPTGIWGGLLALPQFESPALLHARASELAPQACVRALAPRRHAFTHYTLDFTPHVLELPHIPTRATDAGLHWWPLARLADAALPAPLRALLEEFACGGPAQTALDFDASLRSEAQGRPRRRAAQSSGVTPRATRKRDTML